MDKRIGWLTILIALSLFCNKAYCQRDVDFHLIKKFFAGKNILKVKRDYHDPYLWVLAQNNEVYRINSQTQAVDDYTSYFAAYNNLQFVDIAGYSQDTVFVGTNSSTLLELKKGVLNTLGTADGITGAIGQIGVANPQNVIVTNYTDVLPPVLLISTTAGLFQFDVINEKVTLSYTGYHTGIHTLFETTYRNQIYCYNINPGIYNPTDSAKAMALGMQFPVTLFGGSIWYKLQAYGYQINTAYCIKSYYPDNFFYADETFRYDEEDYINEVYGTEKGLYVNSWNYSIYSPPPYNHYLDGIKVNKVTSIYGLTSFPQLIKENLLIGTDQGLYFTNSSYQKYDSLKTHTYNSFTLENDIGNKVINDICVDANSWLPKLNGAYEGTICEDGAWVAALDGLYFIKPDYTPYTDTTQVQAINFIEQPDSSSVNICYGSTVTASINSYYYSGKSIQWFKNGSELTGHAADTLKINTAGNYRAVLYDPCQNIHLQSNQLQVNVISGPQFTFNYPDTLQYCDSASTKLKTTYSKSYHYRWYKNDVLNGDTSSTLAVNQTGKYKVEVSACTNSWVPSKEVQVNLLSVPEPGISIDKIPYCQGDTAHFTSTWLMDTTAFTLRWYKDNTLLPGLNNQYTIKTIIPGSYAVSITDKKTLCTKVSLPFQLSFTPPPSFTFNYPDEINYCQGSPVTLTAQGDPNYQYRWYRNDTLLNFTAPSIMAANNGKYKVEVSACPNSWVPSKEVQLNFIRVPVPAITTNKLAYCIGDNATLSLSTALDPLYTINWYKDNVLVPAYNNLGNITTNVAGTYTAVVISNTASTNGQTCSETSNAIQLSFKAQPTLTIQQQVNTTLCQGQSVTLNAVHSDGTIKWSTGETSDAINASASGTYTATLTSTSGCTVDTSIKVTFLNNPVLSVRDTTICTYKKETVMLTAPAGFFKYTWNNVPGEQTFNVTYPQTIALTVTDANGCQASRQIHITEQCPEVFIPNTFTPNGDGINDVWNVQGLDATALVKIFNRYGALIYQSKGYAIAWDGHYRDQKLPTGTYYYIINTKNNTQTFNGSVTILY
jgi:gliding motility-associated-like protein